MSTTRLIFTITEGYEDLEGLVREIAAGNIPKDATCIYPGTRNQLYLFSSVHGPLVVKCFRRPNIINSLVYTTFRKSKALRSYFNSKVLRRLGFEAPEPIACLEIRRGRRLDKSFYLSRAVEGDTIRFYEMREDCDRMLHSLARCMLAMHLKGVWHKDFSPGNVIVAPRGDGPYMINYVDLNRMEFGVHDHHKQLRMFERINYTEMHTARLARAYSSLLPKRILTLSDIKALSPRDYIDLLGSKEDSLQGLYPLMRSDALIMKGEEYIVKGAIGAWSRFWQGQNRKHRLIHHK